MFAQGITRVLDMELIVRPISVTSTVYGAKRIKTVMMTKIKTMPRHSAGIVKQKKRGMQARAMVSHTCSRSHPSLSFIVGTSEWINCTIEPMFLTRWRDKFVNKRRSAGRLCNSTFIQAYQNVNMYAQTSQIQIHKPPASGKFTPALPTFFLRDLDRGLSSFVSDS